MGNFFWIYKAIKSILESSDLANPRYIKQNLSVPSELKRGSTAFKNQSICIQLWLLMDLVTSLCEKRPKSEFFLDRIFPHLDGIERFKE